MSERVEKRTLAEALGAPFFCELSKRLFIARINMAPERREQVTYDGKKFTVHFYTPKYHPVKEEVVTTFSYRQKDGWTLEEAKRHCEDCGGDIIGEEFYP